MPALPPSEGLQLTEAVGQLRVADTDPGGYDREKFKLWTDADHDGCDARKEVLLQEAVRKPKQDEDCELTGGEWASYYDGKTVSDQRALDIDHMVPLGEAWVSGALMWRAEKRERYANDVEAKRSLVAVSLGPNRSKGDRDPAEWMPPAKSATCRYTADWLSTKLRWKLTVDRTEQAKLEQLARSCPKKTVSYTRAK
ncbi:hypothetical protein AN219_22670 [Streptomyces nanshensis]|nr:hypothetical protein AN219_22670 [Streptomyces nanshensis]